MSKIKSAQEAVSFIQSNAIVAVNSSSGLCCPDAVLAAMGERFDREGLPRNLTSIHPISAGDMFGTLGVDHIAKPGMLTKIGRASSSPVRWRARASGSCPVSCSGWW